MLYYIIMVSSTLLHAASQGAEDKVLYGNPKMTYFKNVFTKARNFATEFTKLSKKPGKIDFGSTFTIDIPNIGDLLAGVYFDFKLSDLKRTTPYTPSDIPLESDSTLAPQFSSYVNGIGYNIIDHVELYINGNLIQRLNSELIYLINELNHNSNQTKSFHRISYYHESFIIANNNVSNVRCQVKLPFYFADNPGLYLPLCSLQHSSIELRIQLKPFEKCIIQKHRTEPYDPLTDSAISGVDGFMEDIGGSANIVPNGTVPEQYAKYNELVEGSIESFDIITQKVFLDPDEQKLFLSVGKLDYLVELFHIGNTETISNPGPESTYTVDIIAKHPTKYIFWVLQRKDVFEDGMYQNYTYDYRTRYDDGYYMFDKNSHILENTEITMNNVNIVEGLHPLFLSNMHKYERFNGTIDNPVYLHNFALSPNDIKPSGTLNLSAYHKKTFRLNLCKKDNYTNHSITPDILFRHYTCHYNVLVISDGTCGLVYK